MFGLSTELIAKGNSKGLHLNLFTAATDLHLVINSVDKPNIR